MEYGTGVFYGPGVLFIVVSGQCEFYVWDKDPAITPFGVWSAFRHGTLGAATAAELAEDFYYADWEALEGVYGPDDPSVRDYSTLHLFDGEHRVGCRYACKESAPEVDLPYDGMLSWVSRLYELGEEATGALRMTVYEAEDFLMVPLDEWPLATPASELVEREQADPDSIYGPGITIDDPDDAAALRSLRESLFQRAAPAAPAQAEHPDPQLQYLFAFRDITPFEDSDGRIPGFYEPLDDEP